MNNKTWRTEGSHRLPDGTICHCGPANAITGPQYADEDERSELTTD